MGEVGSIKAKSVIFFLNYHIMKIIKAYPEVECDRMYCPSTDEVIFAPGYEEINEYAESFIAYWHGEVLYEPVIRDEVLKGAWCKLYENLKESDSFPDMWEIVERFLKEYENNSWVVYECEFCGMACGPVSSTVYFVVKADTVIEIDPGNEEEDEDENEPDDKKVNEQNG